ncbi:MAG: hypothetical protein KKE17_09445 [Proteobacteria bacterium]|nr:hypothetical protein [Pseudomonadota bacterium]MBU1710214.1 hypothetical protein [Pseudomonadota bacterium]
MGKTLTEKILIGVAVAGSIVFLARSLRLLAAGMELIVTYQKRKTNKAIASENPCLSDTGSK